MSNDDDQPDLPILLLPGLNGDPRVFEPQVQAIPDTTVGRWIAPVKSEALADYGKRLARVLDPRRPCIVGGVSFGALAAMEVARHLMARACLVIASSRDVSGLPTPVRLMRPVAAIIPSMALTWGLRYGWESAVRVAPAARRRAAKLSLDEAAFRRWAAQAILTWRGTPPSGCSVFQIHGERDNVFPATRTKADVLVPGAGHMLTLTHAEQVNDFIRSARDAARTN